jgi:hypothetical protein
MELLDDLEVIQELRELDDNELLRKLDCIVTLDQIYLEEETY